MILSILSLLLYQKIIISNMNKVNWNTKEILKFSTWLWDERQYSYSLLAMHGICWGLKIGIQLKLKWEDIIDEKGNPKDVLIIDKESEPIVISNFCKELNSMVFRELKPNISDLIYVNYKTKKVIETSNLSKNLQRFSESYIIDLYGDDAVSKFETMKGTTFQLAWVLDMLSIYNYSKKSFVDVGSYIGKSTLKEMIKFVGFEPKEPKQEIKMRFDLIDAQGVQIVQQVRSRLGNKSKFSDFGFVFKE